MARRIKWMALLLLTNFCLAGGQVAQRVAYENREAFPSGSAAVCEHLGAGC
jgi:hypothetical protein